MEAGFEPSAEDEEQAVQDADRLMNIVKDGAPGREASSGIRYPVSDVVVNLERLGSYLSLAKSLYLPVYGIQTDRGAIVCDPISGMMSTTARFDRLGREFLQDLFRGGGGMMRWFGRMRLLGIDEAMESTRSRLHSYLTTRIVGTKGATNKPVRRTRGRDPQVPRTTFLVDFEVYSQNDDLQVEVSPEYFGTFRYFGAPTSPAVGRIEAGNVFFRANGPNVLDVVDPKVVAVPQNTSYHSKKF